LTKRFNQTVKASDINGLGSLTENQKHEGGQMAEKINLELLAKDVLEVIEKYGIHPSGFGVSCTLKKRDFEDIASNHSDRTHPTIILKTNTDLDGPKWYVQITQDYEVKGYPDNKALSDLQ